MNFHKILLSFKTLVFLNALDVLSTILVVSKKGIEIELNPIFRQFGIEFAVFFKIGSLIYFFALSKIYATTPEKNARVKKSFLLLNVLYISVVINNFLVFVL